ncbi:ribosome biogenesis GTP-binding protein YihA/YsxC [Desulfurispora thermophila]|uniref:ribosome biogenesis GTP-binding protein YihA/YsxC n=1 Tax=Desulfurispora thermophila TaxID=265470 RepID=UPI000366084C|nr:ribosome biogenesis GTP-binding protein YihA/YsxC [Desulfurispora thermophila]
MRILSAEFTKSAMTLKQCPDTPFPEVAVSGRSNVGKSSLINKLVRRQGLAKSSKTPGRTRALNFFLINKNFFLVDLPGYGFAAVSEEMKQQWGTMIEEYLLKRSQLRGVLLLLDIRHAPGQHDRQLWEWLGYYRVPAVLVATKADKLSNNQRLKQLAVIKNALNLPDEQPLIPFSARTGEGLPQLWRQIELLLKTPARGE